MGSQQAAVRAVEPGHDATPTPANTRMAHDMADAAGHLAASRAALDALAADAAALGVLERMAALTVEALAAGGKLLIAGNGGSAADAQHLATEFVVRLQHDRPPMAAIALTTDSSILTAAANDYGYEEVFARQVRALSRPGDVFLGISTSGNSPSVLAALVAARAGGLAAFGWSGEGGGRMASLCDLLLAVPARQTAIVQQLHITVAHVFCAQVEKGRGAGP